MKKTDCFIELKFDMDFITQMLSAGQCCLLDLNAIYFRIQINLKSMVYCIAYVTKYS